MSVFETKAWMEGKNFFILATCPKRIFNVGKFLLIGTFISTVFQVISSKIAWTDANLHIIPSILLLMGMAFLLSLCSSSDAIVASKFCKTNFLSYPF